MQSASRCQDRYLSSRRSRWPSGRSLRFPWEMLAWLMGGRGMLTQADAREQLAERGLVMLCLEADEQLAARQFEHRPLDHRGLRQHQLDRLSLGEVFLVGVRQLAEGGARPVEQRFPAGFLQPAVELGRRDAGALVVVKIVSDVVRLKPG